MTRRVVRFGFALLLSTNLAACVSAADELPGDAGYLTGPCLENACFAGYVCLSELCVDPEETDGEGADDGDDDDSDDMNGSTSIDATESGATTASADATEGSDGSEASEAADEESGSATATDEGGGPTPDGGACGQDDECESGHCFIAGILGGICGECVLDDDCDGGGCTPPNPLLEPPVGSSCNEGALADGCMTDEACVAGLVCAVVVDVPGIWTTMACSECEGDDDCAGSSLCAPDLDVAWLTGALLCVAPGSIGNGETCDFAGSGDAQCDSGHCTVASFMDLIELGVCSECEDDGDCNGQSCEPAVLDADSITPAMCV